MMASSLDGSPISPIRRWNTGASPVSRKVDDDSPMSTRQLQDTVLDLEEKLSKMQSSLEQYKEATDRRFEQLIATIGGLTPAPSSLASSPNPRFTSRQDSGASIDRFMIDVGSSGASTCSHLSVSLTERLALVEQALGESATDKIASSPQRSLGGPAQTSSSLRSRLIFLERYIGESAEKQAKAKAASTNPLLGKSPSVKVTSVVQQTTTVSERLEYVETVVGDSMEKHTRELAAAHVKLDLFAVRVANCESTRDHVSELKSAHDALTKEQAEKHASMKQRLDYLEKLIGDSADQYAKELAQTRKQHADTSASQEKIMMSCQASVDSLQLSLDSHSRSLERVQSDHERLASDFAAHGRTNHSLKRSLDILSSDGQALHLSHASIGDRVQELERKVSTLLHSQ